ncbi:hypothetical protein [Erwinia amylovora]|nr:hypothetical protein [Erwinia amylovora]
MLNRKCPDCGRIAPKVARHLVGQFSITGWAIPRNGKEGWQLAAHEASS